jgi:Mn-dependent DtxR family transcriptional regulator
MTSDHKNIGVSIPEKEKIEAEEYTEKQGQYLAFIYYYIKINGQSPAETDMQRYFNVSPPSVHRMIVELEKKNLIERVKGKARSLKIKLDAAQLPRLI